jgi:hypothetical protein
MNMVRRSALAGVFLVAVLVSAAASAAPASAITDKGLPRGAGIRLLDPGQRIPYLAEEITNGPKVTVKWWVPSRAYTRVKFTFSPFGAARTVAVGRSLGGSFKTAVVAPSTAQAGGKGFVVPPQGWYRFKVTMTLYKGSRTAGRRTLQMYVDLQKPTLQGIDLVTTIDPYNLDDLSLDEWDPLQVQFDDNLPPSVERPGQTHVQLSGIFYLNTAAIVGGGPAGDGLNGKLLGGEYADISPFETGGPTDFHIRPAKDASGAYLPGTYAQKLVFGDAAGNRSTETLVFTVLPAPAPAPVERIE